MDWGTLIPPFDFDAVFVSPWRDLLWVAVLGALVTLSNALVGVFLVLRRMSLVGDAISHSVLPGIVAAFLVANVLGGWVIFLGALVAGVAAAFLIEVLQEKSRVKQDAATGVVFSSLFALGIVMVGLYSGNVHIDTDCVLFGELGHVAGERPVEIGALTLPPAPVLRAGGVAILVIFLIIMFFKELLVTSFDPGLASSLGISARGMHYGLMAVLSMVVVASFEAVGSILVVAMLVIPGATAYLLVRRLAPLLWVTAVFALVSSLGGFHLALLLDVRFGAAIVVVAALLFALAWTGVLVRKAVIRWRRRRDVPDDVSGAADPARNRPGASVRAT